MVVPLWIEELWNCSLRQGMISFPLLRRFPHSSLMNFKEHSSFLTFRMFFITLSKSFWLPVAFSYMNLPNSCAMTLLWLFWPHILWLLSLEEFTVHCPSHLSRISFLGLCSSQVSFSHYFSYSDWRPSELNVDKAPEEVAKDYKTCQASLNTFNKVVMDKGFCCFL